MTKYSYSILIAFPAANGGQNNTRLKSECSAPMQVQVPPWPAHRTDKIPMRLPKLNGGARMCHDTAQGQPKDLRVQAEFCALLSLRLPGYHTLPLLPCSLIQKPTFFPLRIQKQRCSPPLPPTTPNLLPVSRSHHVLSSVSCCSKVILQYPPSLSIF